MGGGGVPQSSNEVMDLLFATACWPQCMWGLWKVMGYQGILVGIRFL